MAYFHNGKLIREGRSWTDSNGIQHPTNWSRWSDQEKQAAGLEWRDDPKPYDNRFYWDADTPKAVEDRAEVDENGDLVLDEKNVVAMKDYPPLTKWLDERGITVHFFDLRTRSFWDGGWHCLTLDIDRNDTKTDLFPDRGSSGVYWRLN
jgi:hypothetical protein